MKKLAASIALGICSATAFAQVDTASIKAGWANLDYAVPESPAFQMLGVSPDNIVKPTSVKSIALSIGNYYLTNGNTIPKNLAVEIAPLLLNQKASLNNYNNNLFLYRMRLSLGTTVGNNGGYNIAEGLRFTIIDKSDLRSNPEALSYFYTHAQSISQITDQVFAAYAAAHPDECSSTLACKEKFATDPTFKKVIMSGLKLNLDSVADFRDRMREKLWNAEIMEVGLGAVQSLPDSLLSNNVTAYKAGLWLTYGNHFSRNDQILFGARADYVDSMTTSHVNVSLGTRYYYGSNELRAFVQAEFKYEGDAHSTVGSAGCVFRIVNGVWGNVALNFILDENNKWSYQPSFSVNLGTPEKKKL